MNKPIVCLALTAVLFASAACAPTPFPPAVPVVPAAATDTPVPPPLPRALYFLAPDANGTAQIFRLERDALTRAQLTFEPADVDDYAVSPLDGALAYVSNNQLYLADAGGGGRRLIVDGGPAEQTADFMSFRMVSHPAWSPNGNALAFGYNGLNLYDPTAGTYANILQNTTQSPSGNPYLRSRYSPYSFSPDGTRLLVQVGWYEGGTLGVLRLSDRQFVEFGKGIVCCDATWAPDGSVVLVGSQYACYVRPGLWRYDAVTGAETALLPDQNPDGTDNFAAFPFLAPDGQLYFFYAAGNPVMECSSGPLTMVRSGVDGVIGRTSIYQPTLLVNEALWFPDASGVVVLRADPIVMSDSEVVIIDLVKQTEQVVNPSPEMNTLKWGR